MDKVEIIEFFVKEFKNMQAEMQIKLAIANEFDEEFENSKDIIEVFILKAKMSIAKQKHNEELQYLEGKCDAYEKVMRFLDIDLKK